MKIANETKIGVLAAVAIVGLILGFNFLKGSSLFEHSKKIYAVFNNVEGMEVSNAVKINGLQIGSVTAIKEADQDLRGGIIVTVTLKSNVNIPKNSIGVINSGLISSSFIQISKGDDPTLLGDGDTLATQNKPNLVSQVQASINPVLTRLESTLQSLDSVTQVVGSLFDPKLKNNFSAIVANLAASSASLQSILNTQTGALSQSLKNVSAFTGNLSKNNEEVTRTLQNAEKASEKLANSRIEETVASLQATMNELKNAIGKINSTNGTLGLLMNDKKLYMNLESSTRSLNILLDDFRVHPKRYVNVSVFGRKDKTGPLTAPLSTNDSLSKPGN